MIIIINSHFKLKLFCGFPHQIIMLRTLSENVILSKIELKVKLMVEIKLVWFQIGSHFITFFDTDLPR